jgi:hypothetical protein
VVNLQCTTSNASVSQKMVFGKPKFFHKATVTITNGASWIPSGTFIKYSVNGLQPKTFKVDGELGIPPYGKASRVYSITLDEPESPWPAACSAFYNN